MTTQNTVPREGVVVERGVLGSGRIGVGGVYRGVKMGGVHEFDDLRGGEFFWALRWVDGGGEGEGAAEDRAELLSAFAEERLAEAGEVCGLVGEGLLSAADEDHGAVNFGAGPEAFGGEFGDEGDFAHGLGDDAEQAVVL